jgi:hypothetical protein
MRRKAKLSIGKNFTLNDGCTHPIGSPLQPLTGRNQTPGILRLFGGTGTAIHDTQGQWRHSTVEPSKLGQQFAILPDHGASPGSPLP